MTTTGGGAQSHGRLWGGRFADGSGPSAALQRLNDSLSYDRRLAHEDIRGSAAYARALERCGVLSAAQVQRVEAGLAQVDAMWRAGTVRTLVTDEDVHTANERLLGEVLGDAALAGSVHTGRSRNDQVALDVRLHVRAAVDRQRVVLAGGILPALLEKAERWQALLVAGRTHWQPAQPVRWAHSLLAHGWRWARDLSRLADVRRRVDVCPLGSGALAGHPFGVDRAQLAESLGFRGGDAAADNGAGHTANSMDAVSDRDFVLDYLHAATVLLVHVSQLAEEFMLHFSAGHVTLPDSLCTGSSLMPQKRNPDALELLRAKSARVAAHYAHVVGAVRAVPLTYNKDLQEDKEPLFDAIDTVDSCLDVLLGVLHGMGGIL